MKKRMKALVSLLLATVMVAMTACGGGDGDKPSGGDASTPNGENEGDNGTAENDAENGGADAGDFLSNVEGLPESLENPNISIVYWYNEDQYAYDTSKNENVYDPVLEAIPYFEEKYGGEVNVIYSAWGEMLETVTALQNANDAPDLFEVFDESLYSVIQSGVVTPLNEYTTDADYSYYDVDKSLFSWGDSTYAIPLKPYAFYIMFNRDLFALEGLQAPDELFAAGEWNWTTFRDSCKALTKQVDGEASQLGYGSYEDTILSFMYANGTTLLNTDTAAGTMTSNLSAPAVQTTLNYLMELNDSIVYGQDMFGWFDNGTLAMIRGKEFPVDLPFEVGMVPFPTGDDYEGKNLVVYPQGMAVPTGAKNPEGAVAFMRVVNELQKAVGDQKEANRIGQENYDLIYSDDVELVYAYDKCLNDANTVIASIVNYMRDGVPAATIAANMEPEIQAQINLLLGN